MSYPKTLYKYRPFNEHSIRTLTHNEIYFANPIKDFNDPFDCRFDLILHDYKDSISAFSEWFYISKVRRKEDFKWFPDLTGRRKKLSRKEIAKRTVKFELDVFGKDHFKRRLYNYISDNVCMLCLAQHSDNILMFTHYAKNHTGIVIGFNTKMLLDSLERKGLKPIIQKVFYTDKAIFQNQADNMKDLVGHIFFTKSIYWSYEEEYRILLEGKSGPYTISDNCVNEVLIGCETPIINIRRIVNLLKERKKKVKLYWEFKHPSNFLIVPYEIDYNQSINYLKNLISFLYFSHYPFAFKGSKGVTF